MSFRQILVRKAHKVRIKDSNIVITKEDMTDQPIPLDDVAMLLFEDPNISLTVRFLTTCAQNYIFVFLCNEKYEPTTIVRSDKNHYNHLEVFYKQLEVSKDTKNKLWDQIIKQKIKNQANVIKYTNSNMEIFDKLNKYREEIVDGDIKNREGSASKLYFRHLFGSEFLRFYDSEMNAGLDYGYKILASAIMRSLTIYGFDLKFGIWHSNKGNLDNLVYDIIEPYRPVVDYFCRENQNNLETPLSFETRKKLINILNRRVVINGKRQTIQNSIDVVAKSYLKVIKGKAEHLVLPDIEEINFYEEG